MSSGSVLGCVMDYIFCFCRIKIIFTGRRRPRRCYY